MTRSFHVITSTGYQGTFHTKTGGPADVARKAVTQMCIDPSKDKRKKSAGKSRSSKKRSASRTQSGGRTWKGCPTKGKAAKITVTETTRGSSSKVSTYMGHRETDASNKWTGTKRVVIPIA